MKRHASLTLNSSTVTCKKYEFSANISQTTGDTDTWFRPIIAQMQLYILPRDEASRFTDFSFINRDVHKISIHSQYLSNHWRYRHVIWANFRLDAALYLAQRWSFTVHWLWFYQPKKVQKHIFKSFKIFFGDILFADPKKFSAKSCLLLKGSHLWNKSHGEHHFLNG